MIGFWLLLISIPLYIIGSFLESLAYHMHGGRSGEYQMTVNQYDDVLLSDGRTGCVVEKFSECDFLVDVGDNPKDWDTIAVTIDDIFAVLK